MKARGAGGRFASARAKAPERLNAGEAAVYDATLAISKRLRQMRRVVENFVGEVPGAPSLDGPSALVLLNAHALGDAVRPLVAAVKAMPPAWREHAMGRKAADNLRDAWDHAQAVERYGREMASADNVAFRRTMAGNRSQYEINVPHAVAAIEYAEVAMTETRDLLDGGDPPALKIIMYSRFTPLGMWLERGPWTVAQEVLLIEMHHREPAGELHAGWGALSRAAILLLDLYEDDGPRPSGPQRKKRRQRR